MPDVLFILLSGGFLLGSALPNPLGVRRAWLRWTSGLSLGFAAVGTVLALTLPHKGVVPPAFFTRIQTSLLLLTVACAVADSIVVGVGRLRLHRWVAAAGFVVSVLAGSNLLHGEMFGVNRAVPFPPKAFSVFLQTLSSAGAAALPGVAFAAALFPLFGVTTPEPSALSFRRLYRALWLVLVTRAVVSVGAGVTLLGMGGETAPDPMTFNLMYVRWLLGLVAPAGFAYAAYRRAARGRVPTAAALLLVGALGALNGEAMALWLVRETGLPF